MNGAFVIHCVYFVVILNGESDDQNDYPVVSTLSRVDVLSSPDNGTSESKYQKRWQHWQQHQHLSPQLLQTTNKVMTSKMAK